MCDGGRRQPGGAAAVFTHFTCSGVLTFTCGAVLTGQARDVSSAGAGRHPELQAQTFVRLVLLGTPRRRRLLPGRSFPAVASVLPSSCPQPPLAGPPVGLGPVLLRGRLHGTSQPHGLRLLPQPDRAGPPQQGILGRGPPHGRQVQVSVGELSRSGISELHSSVSDRNYLEHVAESISDWTRAEELKREAARAQTSGPAQLPKGAKRSRLMLENHEMEENSLRSHVSRPADSVGGGGASDPRRFPQGQHLLATVSASRARFPPGV